MICVRYHKYHKYFFNKKEQFNLNPWKSRVALFLDEVRACVTLVSRHIQDERMRYITVINRSVVVLISLSQAMQVGSGTYVVAAN